MAVPLPRLSSLVAAVLLLSAASCACHQPTKDATSAAALVAPSALSAPLRPEPTFGEGAAPAFALTASDGTGLALDHLAARVVVEGPLASTELHLAFVNPEPRVREGTFRITLPPRASIARFAMRIGDRWQEAEIVEKQRAREAYEDFLHRRRDPALLEQAAGNELRVRVFPIGANETKELIVAYSEELRGDGQYVLPLRGLPQIGRIDFDAAVLGAPGPVASLHERQWTPAADLVVDAGPRTVDALRAGSLTVARVHPVLVDDPEPIGSAIVLVDTSASRALGLETETRWLEDLAERLAATPGTDAVRWTVAAFDQSVEEVYSGPLDAVHAHSLDAIRRRGALGASDLERALEWARRRAATDGATRLLVVTDGVATAGATDAKSLAAAVRATGGAGVQRLDAVSVGGLRDEAALEAMVSAGLPHDGAVVTATDGTASAASRLTRRVQAHLPVRVEGARWSYPATVDRVQPGDDVIVYADVPRNAPLTVVIGHAPPVRVTPWPGDGPLIQRAVAKARIDGLLQARPGDAKSDASRRREVVALSKAYGVLSPYTSMLVLETEDDETGHDVAPFARENESPFPELERPATPSPRSSSTTASGDDSIEIVGMETAGHGAGMGSLGSGGVGGNGRGRLGGGHQVRAVRLRGSASEVVGLPPQTVERIVMPIFGRLRLCYENGLRGDPNLSGRVSVRVTIDVAGAVMSTADRGSLLPAPSVLECAVRAFASLKFPMSGDGASSFPKAPAARFVYSVDFAPGGSGDDATTGRALPSSRRESPADPAMPETTPVASGILRDVAALVDAGRSAEAVAAATRAHGADPGDLMALVALGQALEAAKDLAGAARAYGSIIDLFPSSADMRRMAGERLEAIADPAALDLAVDTYRKAVADRPDHPSGHRLLAYALLKKGNHSGAFDAIVDGIDRSYPEGRFLGVDRVLRDDAGLIAAVWATADPAQTAAVTARLARINASMATAPSLRFVLNWESDANDVDLHVADEFGEHAFYGHPRLKSGGALYADVTTGYGPECFVVPRPRPGGGRYRLKVHYYARGPMGVGMGKLEILAYDGRGHISFGERPFVVTTDGAVVDLGST